jgi:hypothetical protein
MRRDRHFGEWAHFLFALLFLLPLAGKGDEMVRKLLAPETRMAALKKVLEIDEPFYREQTLEEFSADVGFVSIFDLPQPGFPSLKVVLWSSDYELYETEKYEELTEVGELAEAALIWEPGRPWLDGCALLLLTDEKVIPDSWEFLPAGVFADWDGDGFIDLIEITKISIESKDPEVGEKWMAERVTVRSVIPGYPWKAAFLCHPRKSRIQAAERRLSMRMGAGKQFELAFSDASGGETGVLSAAEEGAKPDFGTEIQPGIFFLTPGPGDKIELDRFAKEILGIPQPRIGRSSARVWELSHPKKRSDDSLGEWPHLAKSLEGLSPAEASLAAVEEYRGDLHRELYELRLAEKPDPIQKGWVETLVEPGWSDSVRTVWWLPEAGLASTWDLSGLGSGSVRRMEIDREPLAWWMDWLAALDSVRSRPRFLMASHPSHSTAGGDDHTRIKLDLVSLGKDPRSREFHAVPTLWYEIRGPYDREVAGLIAAIHAAPWSWEPSGEIERISLREALPEWIDDADLRSHLPAPVIRHAILAAGWNGWEEHREGLTRLRSIAESESPEAQIYWKGLQEIQKVEREKGWMWFHFATGDDKEEQLELQQLDHELCRLRSVLAGTVTVEFRETVEVALRMLEEREDPEALEEWGKSKEPGSKWAWRLLQRLR